MAYLQDESIENWKIVRTVDGKERDPYVLDDRFKSVKPGAKITVIIARPFYSASLSYLRRSQLDAMLCCDCEV